MEGYAIVHRREGRGKSDNPGGGKKPGGGAGACYSFLGSGAKWKTIESWKVDESGSPVGNMLGLLSNDVQTWESAAGNNGLFGSGASDQGYDANLDQVDGVNGAEFGSIADPNVIAVTYVWGWFNGPPSQRELVEWDMLFDSDGDWAWATDGNPNAMDFENIATHELGHAMGLGHPDATCTEETMYAYAGLGETKKRDLNAGDIEGINKLY